MNIKLNKLVLTFAVLCFSVFSVFGQTGDVGYKGFTFVGHGQYIDNASGKAYHRSAVDFALDKYGNVQVTNGISGSQSAVFLDQGNVHSSSQGSGYAEIKGAIPFGSRSHANAEVGTKIIFDKTTIIGVVERVNGQKVAGHFLATGLVIKLKPGFTLEKLEKFKLGGTRLGAIPPDQNFGFPFENEGDRDNSGPQPLGPLCQHCPGIQRAFESSDNTPNNKSKIPYKHKDILKGDSKFPLAMVTGTADGAGRVNSSLGDSKKIQLATEEAVERVLKQLEEDTVKALNKLKDNRPSIVVGAEGQAAYRKQIVDALSQLKAGAATRKVQEAIKASAKVGPFSNGEQYKLSGEANRILVFGKPADFKYENLKGDSEKEVTKSATILETFESIKTTLAQYWPKDQQEWEAIATVMGPLLLEVGLAAIPGSEIIDIFNGIQEEDYWKVGLAFGGLGATFFGGKIVKVVGKLGVAIHKSFKIIRVVGKNLKALKALTSKGFKAVVDSAGNVVLEKAGKVIAKGDGAVKEFLQRVATGKFSLNEIKNIAKSATNNPTSKKVMLGKFNEGGVSYVKEAGKDFSFFELKNWDEVYESVAKSDSEIWKVNAKFLKNQFTEGKKFFFSHDPSKATGFFKQEVNYIKGELNAKGFEKVGKYWQAIF